MAPGTARKNRLAAEKSPYLLQHAENPVDWWPWGPEAFAEARRRDVPLLVSVGYAACHWCHVMAHESFEDPVVAAVLNEAFVCVKVDREERPDVDHLCMAACQALTGRGGWPLNAFLTPGGKPFFAGTYFPRHSTQGMPGFTDVVRTISRLWAEDRERLLSTAEQLVRALSPSRGPESQNTPGTREVAQARALLSRSFDPVHGGFGLAPKFPSPHNLMFLLRLCTAGQDSNGELAGMVEKTLFAMRRGGIYDQLGGGIHRYSVDERWMVPHFEKMLYDQALTALACLDAYAWTKDSRHLEMAQEILHYVVRDLAQSHGGFATAEDADTEGGEGETYVWTPAQFREALPPDLAELAVRFFGVTDTGTFEKGKSVLSVPVPVEALAPRLGVATAELTEKISKIRELLLAARRKRPQPLLDDKIITGQNGLMMAALARGYAACGDPELLSAARKAAAFILDRLSAPDGGLLRRFRDGQAAIPGFLDDYAWFVWGLLELFQAAFAPEDLAAALRLTDLAQERFADPETGGLLSSGSDNEKLALSFSEIHDGATPSPVSVFAHNLLTLFAITGEARYEEKARALIRSAASEAGRNPVGCTHLLSALLALENPGPEVVITGAPEDEKTKDLLRAISGAIYPGLIRIRLSPGPGEEALVSLVPRLSSYAGLHHPPRAFVCRGRTCLPPVFTGKDLAAALAE
ncbi:MAG: thioredoxin domain-containing protein [Thermodesulfobacteriota bacterium]